MGLAAISVPGSQARGIERPDDVLSAAGRVAAQAAEPVAESTLLTDQASSRRSDRRYVGAVPAGEQAVVPGTGGMEAASTQAAAGVQTGNQIDAMSQRRAAWLAELLRHAPTRKPASDQEVRPVAAEFETAATAPSADRADRQRAASEALFQQLTRILESPVGPGPDRAAYKPHLTLRQTPADRLQRREETVPRAVPSPQPQPAISSAPAEPVTRIRSLSDLAAQPTQLSVQPTQLSAQPTQLSALPSTPTALNTETQAAASDGAAAAAAGGEQSPAHADSVAAEGLAVAPEDLAVAPEGLAVAPEGTGGAVEGGGELEPAVHETTAPRSFLELGPALKPALVRSQQSEVKEAEYAAEPNELPQEWSEVAASGQPEVGAPGSGAPGSGAAEELPAADPLQDPDESFWHGTRIGQINLDVSPPPQIQLPDESRQAQALQQLAVIRYVSGPARPGIDYGSLLSLADFCHRPLYFQEINLERYGTHHGILQPAISAGRFFTTIPMLPYKMAIERPNVCYHYYHPYQAGRPAPWEKELPPLRANAALVEAGVVLGLIFLIP